MSVLVLALMRAAGAAPRPIVGNFTSGDIHDIDLGSAATSNAIGPSMSNLSGLKYDGAGKLYGWGGGDYASLWELDDVTGYRKTRLGLVRFFAIEGGLAYDPQRTNPAAAGFVTQA